MDSLEINLDCARKKIISSKAKTVLLQIPEGLKDKATELMQELSKGTKAEIICLMDPCFGACDANPILLKELNADLMVHLGHLPVYENEKIVFVPLKYKAEKNKIKKLAEIVEKKLIQEKINSIALIATAQYLEYANELKKELEKKEKTKSTLKKSKNKLKILTSKGTGRIKEEMQVLGCNYSSIKRIKGKFKAIVFLGDGLFHPLGAAYGKNMKVFALNPKNEELKEISGEKDRFLRKRFAAIAKAMEAKSFGIIISRKLGQKFVNKAIELKKKIELRGKKAFLFSVDYVNENYFLGAKLDCFVITACPRIVFDDAQNWKTNIITPNELMVALGEKKWEEMEIDELK